MTTDEESTEEEEYCGDDSQENDFISLSFFSYSNDSSGEFTLPYCYFFTFYDVGVALYPAWEGELLDMESEEKIH